MSIASRAIESINAKRNLAILLLSAVVLGILTATLSLYIPAVAFGFVMVLLAFWQPKIFIFGLVLFTIFEETLLRWLPSEVRYLGEVTIIFLLIAVIFKQVLRRGKITYRRTPLELPLVAFLVVAFASALFNKVPFVVAVLGIRPWLRYIGLYYLVTLLEWPKATQKRFLWGLFALAIFEAGLGLIQAIGGVKIAQWFAPKAVEIGGSVIQSINPSLIGNKIFGTLGRYDRFGNYLMLMLLFGVAIFPSLSFRRRIGLLAGLMVIAIALVLSFSRQAWIGMVIGIGLITVIDKRRSYLLIILVGIILFLAVLLITVPPSQSTSGGNPATIFTRLLEPFSQYYWRALNEVGGRLYYIFVIGPKLLAASPWIGLGPGRFGSLVTQIYPTPVYEDLGIPKYFAESFSLDIQWMAMIGQVGLIGLLVFYWIFIRLVLQAYRQYKSALNRSFYQGLTLTFLVWSIAVFIISFLGPNFEVRVISQNYWLLAGLIIANKQMFHKMASSSTTVFSEE